jgi:hypothetical protein
MLFNSQHQPRVRPATQYAMTGSLLELSRHGAQRMLRRTAAENTDVICKRGPSAATQGSAALWRSAVPCAPCHESETISFVALSTTTGLSKYVTDGGAPYFSWM